MTATFRRLAAVLLTLCFSGMAAAQTPAWGNDPVLQAMDAELKRSKLLKLEGVQSPYFIQYNVVDVDLYTLDSAFGSLRGEQRLRTRMVRVVVRVGDYKQDSFFREGEGSIQLMPIEDDLLALRHQLWWATDQAYKNAAEALTAKQAALKQYEVDQPVDDFSHEAPVSVLEPAMSLDLGARDWADALNKVTGLYRQDPDTESFEASGQFRCVNRYLLNSEGTVARTGTTSFHLSISGHAQAADGMKVMRSASYSVDRLADLPSDERLRTDALRLLADLKSLRAAPVADEEYRGPVLLAPGAAATVFKNLVADNLLGKRPRPGVPSRTTGAFANSYKNLVLPDFISVVDDATLDQFAGKRLLGHYSIDDEGVRPQPVQLVENGILKNYLVGRQPIRDFPNSNGHGLSSFGQPPTPQIGNFMVKSSKTTPSAEMKKQLLELCRKRGLSYGYLIEQFATSTNPQVIYRVSVADGKQEIVRGAEVSELDLRAIRNGIIAAGDDASARNSVEPLPHSVISPSILLDEVLVKRTGSTKDKLPQYPAPALTSAR